MSRTACRHMLGRALIGKTGDGLPCDSVPPVPPVPFNSTPGRP
ncbi:MAG: hypothetical protein ACOX86_04835 [Pelotomaculaceae bacterium]|nr:hypothetical protein [Bacillota bacterium]